MGVFLKKRVRVQGFIIFDDYGQHYGEFLKQMSEWYAAGSIKYREDMVDGLENAPAAFIGLWREETLASWWFAWAADELK